MNEIDLAIVLAANYIGRSSVYKERNMQPLHMCYTSTTPPIDISLGIRVSDTGGNLCDTPLEVVARLRRTPQLIMPSENRKPRSSRSSRRPLFRRRLNFRWQSRTMLNTLCRCGTGDAPTRQPIRPWRTTSLACAPIASPSHRPTRTNTSYGPGPTAPPTYNNRRLRMIVCSGCKHSHIICANAYHINGPSVVGNAPVILCAPRSIRSSIGQAPRTPFAFSRPQFAMRAGIAVTLFCSALCAVQARPASEEKRDLIDNITKVAEEILTADRASQVPQVIQVRTSRGLPKTSRFTSQVGHTYPSLTLHHQLFK
ncbi:hypothetical protein C2E23DRAFT_72125 [Lenzites betulinus]|nr:hypothetical protein C2E23DRAFT_72125 [Lenzites betulinus]